MSSNEDTLRLTLEASCLPRISSGWALSLRPLSKFLSGAGDRSLSPGSSQSDGRGPLAQAEWVRTRLAGSLRAGSPLALQSSRASVPHLYNGGGGAQALPHGDTIFSVSWEAHPLSLPGVGCQRNKEGPGVLASVVLTPAPELRALQFTFLEQCGSRGGDRRGVCVCVRGGGLGRACSWSGR